MREEILIHSVIDGHAAKVNEMLAEFEEQNQDHSVYEPVIRFSDDVLFSRNVISFLTAIRSVHPIVIFETNFPKDTFEPSLMINSVLNYLNAYPKIPNRFILHITTTDEKKRKELFNGKVLGLSDISKMFTKQPLSKNKPIIELDSGAEIDANKISGLFAPNKFSFSISPATPSVAKQISAKLTAAGFEPFNELEDTEEFMTSLFMQNDIPVSIECKAPPKAEIPTAEPTPVSETPPALNETPDWGNVALLGC